MWSALLVIAAAQAGPVDAPPEASGGAARPGAVVEALGYKMVVVPPGTFSMGALPGDDANPAIPPYRAVRLTRAFAIGATEVSRSLYTQVVSQDPTQNQACGVFCPVTDVTWLDAVRFCNALSAQEGLAAAYIIKDDVVTWDPAAPGYRLPTEAEWEYAARAGADTLYAGSDDPELVAWAGTGSALGVHMVAGKRPNRLGLHDMSGNVGEWVWDRYDRTLPMGRAQDPTGPAQGRFRVRRGGGYRSGLKDVRLVARAYGEEAAAAQDVGFRLARTVEAEP